MPLVFRKIRQSRWLKEDLDFDWILPGEIPGDPLADLAPVKGDLSVYLVDNDSSSLERVTAALATIVSSLSYVDYILMELIDLQNAGFKFNETDGETADNLVNRWHRDIVELSGSQVLALARIMWNSESTRIGRVPEKKILKLIVDGVSTGAIDRDKIRIKSDKLHRELDHLL